MSTKRRSFLAGTLAGSLVSLGLAACGEGQVVTGVSSASGELPTLVLVHGSLHGAFCWARVTPFLVAAGFKVLPVDLPGCGLNGRFPVSSYARPFDAAAYSSELSPVASVTLEDYTQAVGSGFNGRKRA
ncbi:alpha/beta fold hydrolase [Paraburkholderia aspalathi]|uniref:alpha/beta fold hydrolase n=1 Tax=Paraburkholderia aspalathi TaxID=1324617 RepID=UPI0038BD18D0